jgi:hypothetical protein
LHIGLKIVYAKSNKECSTGNDPVSSIGWDDIDMLWQERLSLIGRIAFFQITEGGEQLPNRPSSQAFFPMTP